MSYIAFLDLQANNPLNHLGGMQMVFLSQGAEIRPFTGIPSDFNEFMDDARSYIIWTDRLLSDEMIDCLLKHIKAGKNAWIRVDSNTTTSFNNLLHPFHIEATSVGIARYDGSPDIAVHRESRRRLFLDDELLANIDVVTISDPRLMKFGGDAEPVLTIPIEEGEPLDFDTDIWADWSSQYLPCCVRSSPEGFKGEICVYSGNMFFDSQEATRGIKRNLGFCSNMAKWLMQAPAPPGSSATKAYKKLDKIERKLRDVCIRVLRKYYADGWWSEGVPLETRKKCVERREEEKNLWPKHAYLDLLDFEKIIRNNWGLFQKELETVGWGQSKSAGLSWFGKLNETRKKIAHPAKRGAGDEVSNSEIELLQRILDKVDILYTNQGGWEGNV